MMTMTEPVAHTGGLTRDGHHYAVTESGKIYWCVRNRLGEFCREDGTNRSTRTWTLAAWHAYLAARYAAAEADTRGNLVNSKGRSLGISGMRLLRPGASLFHASRELMDWFGVFGPTLSWTAFARQITEEPDDGNEEEG